MLKNRSVLRRGWCSTKLAEEFGKQISFYADVKGMTLLALNGMQHNLVIQVMGTSFVKNRVAYLPEIPSAALNERLTSLLWMKGRGQDPRLLFIVCRNDEDSFSANAEVDPDFLYLLRKVRDAGIPVDALRCSVDENGMSVEQIIPVLY